MAMDGFINSADATNIKLRVGNAQLKHESVNVSDSSSLSFGPNTEDFYFELEGENSEFYEIDQTTVTEVVSKIKPRPVNVKITVPPKVYDGNFDFDLSTCAYEFLPTNEQESGLVVGSELFPDVNLQGPNMIGDSSEFGNAYAALDSNLSVLGNNYGVVYTTSVTYPGGTRYIYNHMQRRSTEKCLQLPFVCSEDNKFSITAKSDSLIHQQTLGLRNYQSIDNDLDLQVMQLKHDESTVDVQSSEVYSVTAVPNSRIRISHDPEASGDITVCGPNLVDNALLDLQAEVYDKEPTSLFTYYKKSVGDELIPLRYNGEAPTTLRKILEHAGVSTSATIYSRLDAYVDGMRVTSGVEITTRVPPPSSDDGFVIIVPGQDYECLAGNARQHQIRGAVWDKPLYLRIRGSGRVDIRAWALSYIYGAVNTPEDVNTLLPLYKQTYTASSRGELFIAASPEGFTHIVAPFDFEATIESPLKAYATPVTTTIETQLVNAQQVPTDVIDTSYRSDVPLTDFGRVLLEVDSISCSPEVNADIVTSLTVANPRLVGEAANNYRINEVTAISKVLQKPITVTHIPGNKMWDGNASFDGCILSHLNDVCEGDDVRINPAFFDFYTVTSNAGTGLTVICDYRKSEAPLLGRDARFYKLVGWNYSVAADILRIPVEVIGEELLIDMNNRYDRCHAYAVKPTYHFVNYNNNTRVDGLELPLWAFFVNGLQLSVWYNCIVSHIDEYVDKLNWDGHSVSLEIEGETYTLTDGEEVRIDIDPLLLGGVNANNVNIFSPETTMRVKIQQLH